MSAVVRVAGVGAMHPHRANAGVTFAPTSGQSARMNADHPGAAFGCGHGLGIAGVARYARRHRWLHAARHTRSAPLGTNAIHIIAAMSATKEWFEMKELRKRDTNRSAWIPLHAAWSQLEGKCWEAGCVEEHFSCTAIVVPTEQEESARALGWGDRPHGSARPDIDDGEYTRANIYRRRSDTVTGELVVLTQEPTSDGVPEWHLDQELVLALRLHREGDSWVSAEEDFEEVVRLRRGSDRRPSLIEIRAPHFKDYLAARGCGAVLISYRSRTAVAASHPSFAWTNESAKQPFGGGVWEGHVRETHTDGSPFGSQTAVFQMSREGDELAEDSPSIAIGDAGVTTKSWKAGNSGPKVFFARGEYWRTEWISPGTASPRVRGDRVEPTVEFVVDASGAREHGDSLCAGARWLFFNPRIVRALLSRRGGRLVWFSHDTGGVGLESHGAVHFGVNELGLVNVFTKDVGSMPEHAQRIWASENALPEGGVSRELIMAQMKCSPASTTAPEEQLATALANLNTISEAQLKGPLLRQHDKTQELLRDTHRFQCLDREGLFFLCKQLNRLITERLDVGLLRRMIPSPAGLDKAGSLRLLEAALKGKVPDPRALLAPLAGIYDLRHADAHLPGSDYTDALRLVGLDLSKPWIVTGARTIEIAAAAVQSVADSIAGSRLGDHSAGAAAASSD